MNTGDYRLGADTGSLRLYTYREGFGSRAGHDLVIEVTSWSGQAHVDPSSLGNSSFSIVAEVTSLEVTEGRGGVKALTAADRSDIKVTLERILEASSFPMIEFQSIHVNGLGGRAEIDGELSIRGTKAPARLYATLSEEADRLEVVGEATVAQSRFGIKPYTAFLGALRVRDAVQVALEAELIPLI